MDYYKVTLISEDNNKFEFSTEATCVLDAEFKAFKKINDNEWDHHNYKLHNIETIETLQNIQSIRSWLNLILF